MKGDRVLLFMAHTCLAVAAATAVLIACFVIAVIVSKITVWLLQTGWV